MKEVEMFVMVILDLVKLALGDPKNLSYNQRDIGHVWDRHTQTVFLINYLIKMNKSKLSQQQIMRLKAAIDSTFIPYFKAIQPILEIDTNPKPPPKNQITIEELIEGDQNGDKT